MFVLVVDCGGVLSLQGGALCVRASLLPPPRDASLSIAAVLPERAVPHAAVRDHPSGGGGGTLLRPGPLHLLQG